MSLLFIYGEPAACLLWIYYFPVMNLLACGFDQLQRLGPMCQCWAWCLPTVSPVLVYVESATCLLGVYYLSVVSLLSVFAYSESGPFSPKRSLIIISGKAVVCCLWWVGFLSMVSPLRLYGRLWWVCKVHLPTVNQVLPRLRWVWYLSMASLLFVVYDSRLLSNDESSRARLWWILSRLSSESSLACLWWNLLLVHPEHAPLRPETDAVAADVSLSRGVRVFS